MSDSFCHHGQRRELCKSNEHQNQNGTDFVKQMAVQAVLDSSPLQLLAKPSPGPSDVIWPNTYRSRNWRIFRSWSITAIITILTVFWSVILVPIAGLIDIDRIHKVWPALAEMLSSHPLAKSLVQTQLPTLVVSLLNILVPYFYDCMDFCFPYLFASLTTEQGYPIYKVQFRRARSNYPSYRRIFSSPFSISSSFSRH